MANSAMQVTDVVLFLQNRATRAGAQTSLARLVTQPPLRALTPVVVLGEEGWLADWCQEYAVANIVTPFPRSRSLQGRLWGNARFAYHVRTLLQANGWRPRVIVANDHQDSLLSHAVASACGARSVVILRTPGMSQRDFFKYGCNRADALYAVGKELQLAAGGWSGGRHVHLYREGLAEEEFLPPKPRPENFPARVLIAGSEVSRKGWADWVTALDRLEISDSSFRLDCDFTGIQPDPARNDLYLTRQRRSRFRFLGRVEDFRGLVRQYDLVVHPSRHESFGLAPIEVLAAGVPLLCSRTGAIGEVLDDDRFLFEPSDTAELAAKLTALRLNWRTSDPRLDFLQARIKKTFSAAAMAIEFARTVHALG
ncbi:MAG TPA: glycosyltransferase family 4 protein [Nevskiales bacterium]|nr:glycosyltransferase family 4 protein [Nevskiales bacterium]